MNYLKKSSQTSEPRTCSKSSQAISEIFVCEPYFTESNIPRPYFLSGNARAKKTNEWIKETESGTDLSLQLKV